MTRAVKVVKIMMNNGAFAARPSSIILRRQTLDAIVWENQTDVDCWVCFHETPLDVIDIFVGAQGTSEPQTVGKVDARAYTYDLATDAEIQSDNAWLDFARGIAPEDFGPPDKPMADPQVIVH